MTDKHLISQLKSDQFGSWCACVCGWHSEVYSTPWLAYLAYDAHLGHEKND